MSRAAFNFTYYTIYDARLLLCLRRGSGGWLLPMKHGPLPTTFEARRLPPCLASARRRAVLGVGRDLRNQRDGEPGGPRGTDGRTDGPALVW